MALTVALAGCAHYTPRPLPPERVVTDFADRRLDDPRLHAALDAKLPARAGVNTLERPVFGAQAIVRQQYDKIFVRYSLTKQVI